MPLQETHFITVYAVNTYLHTYMLSLNGLNTKLIYDEYLVHKNALMLTVNNIRRAKMTLGKKDRDSGKDVSLLAEPVDIVLYPAFYFPKNTSTRFEKEPIFFTVPSDCTP